VGPNFDLLFMKLGRVVDIVENKVVQFLDPIGSIEDQLRVTEFREFLKRRNMMNDFTETLQVDEETRRIEILSNIQLIGPLKKN